MGSVMKPHKIKRGVSLYSFQEEFFLSKLTLEQCIATSAGMGALGIESLAEQMMPGFPKLSDEFYATWHGWMEHYGTTPTCHDLFLDTMRRKDRLMTEDEQVESMIRDIKHTHRIGATLTRALNFISPPILEKCVPYAEKYNVRIGLEIHAPIHFDHPWIMRHFESMERIGSPFLGFIPDMGIFTKRYPRVQVDQHVRNGATPEIAEYITQAWSERILSEYVVRDVRKLGGNPVDIRMAEQIRHMVWSHPKRLLEFMPRIFHIHAKFYEMLPDCTDQCIAYDEVIPVLIEGGFEGYLSSEYEGNRHIQDILEVDSVEQVRRQQEMFKRLLGETETSHV
jgi:sugar phosphate isomerase/epimerase